MVKNLLHAPGWGWKGWLDLSCFYKLKKLPGFYNYASPTWNCSIFWVAFIFYKGGFKNIFYTANKYYRLEVTGNQQVVVSSFSFPSQCHQDLVLMYENVWFCLTVTGNCTFFKYVDVEDDWYLSQVNEQIIHERFFWWSLPKLQKASSACYAVGLPSIKEELQVFLGTRKGRALAFKLYITCVWLQQTAI